MGNSGGSSGLGSSGGAIGHSRPTTDKHFAQSEMTDDEKLAWIMNVTGASEAEAKEMLDAVREYLNGDDNTFKDIHSGKNKKVEALINKFLNNKNVPIFAGETFRGVYIRSQNGRSAESIVQDILNTGRWQEPGISSFSSDRSVAMDFALGSGRGASVILRKPVNRTGVPVAHLSEYFDEYEVLHPAGTYKITGWRRNGNMYYVDISE